VACSDIRLDWMTARAQRLSAGGRARIRVDDLIALVAAVTPSLQTDQDQRLGTPAMVSVFACCSRTSLSAGRLTR